MKYSNYDIYLSEVPNEISIGFSITGCPLRCPGCHSPELRNGNIGKDLTIIEFKRVITVYKPYISCVLFLGGEWHAKELCALLDISKNFGLKTCLYTGLDVINQEIYHKLNFLKTGPYIEKLGPLGSETTNQKFINVNTGENLNHLFLFGEINAEIN